MTDFKSAFKDGLEAAKKSQMARSEIDELNRQLSEVSEGKIQIKRMELESETTPLEEIAGFFRRRPYWAIVAQNPTMPQYEKELAKWSQDPSGYPCGMSWAGHEVFYEDRQALERGLANLLRDPVVGEILKTLMRTGASGGHDKARE
jgi:hypothetical protein